MTARLEHILHRMPVVDLKIGLGDEICNIVEFITGDLTKPALVKAAARVYGKEILEKRELRFLLLECLLDGNRIKQLASDLHINYSNQSVSDIMHAIADKPYKNDKSTLLILQSLGLNEQELPEPAPDLPTNMITLEKPKENFYELLDYQNDIRLEILRYFKEMPGGRALVHIPTGTGKTKTTMHLLKDFWYIQYRENAYVLWLAHSQELLEQAISTFQEVWKMLGRDEITCIRLWGNYPFTEQFNKNAFIFATVQKLISLKNRQKNTVFLEDFRSRIAMIVLDEAHRAPARETYNLLDYLLKTTDNENRYLLGLTATPGRAIDAENKRLVNLFENTRFKIDLNFLKRYMPAEDKDLSFTSTIQYLQHKEILAKFEKREIEIPSNELGFSLRELQEIKKFLKKNTEKELTGEILKKIVKSQTRNRQIIDALTKAHNEEGHTILVFACNVAHAKMLSFAMTLKDIPNGLILGGTKAIRRNELICEYKDENDSLRMLISVEVLTTGFDAPNTSCLMITRPVNSVILYSQMLGRGIRGKAMGGSKSCLLIQVVDKIDLGDEKWAFEYFNEYWS